MSAATATIALGTKISLTVVKRPTNQGAAKTLVRLLRKDALVKKEAARLRKARKVHFHQEPRGGRVWDVHRPSIAPVKPVPGVTGTLIATADVLIDLKKLARFVEVKAVK